MEYDFLVLFPVNPLALKRFRQTFATSGAKDHPTDADLLLELLSKHRDRLRVWTPDDPKTRALGRLVEARRKFYYGHNCRRGDLIEKRLQEIRVATPLTTDTAIVDTSVLTVQMLAGQIRLLGPSIARYEEEIKKLLDSHPDAELFEALPGAGAALVPRLLTALGTDRKRFRTATEVQQYSGIAPVTERSGKKTWVHWRWAASTFVRQSFHEFAGLSIQQSA